MEGAQRQSFRSFIEHIEYAVFHFSGSLVGDGYGILLRFPDPDPDKSRRSKYNRKALKRADALVEKIQAQRAEYYEKMAAELGQEFKLKVVNTFWIINAISIRARPSAVHVHAKRSSP